MSIYDFKNKDKYGNMVSLNDFKDKVILIINSATQCGFTPQYDDLQDLYEKYGNQGFVILDFPCNQFGNQAPGTDEEIASFCEARYGITFPVFSKTEVIGDHANPLFGYLVKEKGFKGFNMEHPLSPTLHGMLSRENPKYENQPDIKWNFTKFLIDRHGTVVDRFEPSDSFYEIEEKIKELL